MICHPDIDQIRDHDRYEKLKRCLNRYHQSTKYHIFFIWPDIPCQSPYIIHILFLFTPFVRNSEQCQPLMQSGHFQSAFAVCS